MTSTLRLSGSFVLTALILVLLFATPGMAQYQSGIEGTVLDQSGAVIPGAACTVTNQDTQITQTATSDGQGYFRIPHLNTGKYKVEISAPGFEKWAEGDILVEGNAVRVVYPKLKIGQTVATVQVRSDLESLETTRGTISRTLEEQTIADSPLDGDNIYASVGSLAPGVTGLGEASGSIASAGSQGTNSFSTEQGFQINAAGQRQDANEFQVDGTTVNGDSRDGVVNITPEPDTVAEMKVTASTFSAEKGLQSGALIEIFTKSGTNKFHGTLSEMHSDAAMTARREGQIEVAHSLRNDFGGTVGGPIFKDHTFFFGSLFWMKSLLGQPVDEYLETQAYENYVEQNFPSSVAAQFFKAAPPAAYPTSNFLTMAQNESSYGSPLAPPNIPGTLVTTGLASFNESPFNNGFQGHIRIDHNFNNDRDKLFYSLYDNHTQAQHADPRPALDYVAPDTGAYNKLDYLHTFSPVLVNEASITFGRVTGAQNAPLTSLPTIYYIGGIDDDFSQWGPSGWAQNNWYIHDTLSYTRGKHNIRVGIDVDRLADLDNFENGDVRPYFYFLNLADMAADHPFYQSGPVMNPVTEKTATNLYQQVGLSYVAPYIQDDFKVNNRLTLNLGLRFDDYGHLASVKNSNQPIAFFTPGSGGSFQSQVASGGMSVRGGNGNATTNAQFRVAPRFGFAWDVFGDGSTAIHGGYGFFNNRIGEYSYVNNMRTNPPSDVDPSLDLFSGDTEANFSYGTSTSGATGFAPPPGLSFQVSPNGGIVGTRISVGGIDPNLKTPIVHTWALGIQRKISGFMIEADYFGTAGRDLFLQTDINRFAGDEIINNGNLTRLNQSFGIVDYGRSIGISNSNVAAFAISRHFSRGWTAHAIYTIGKSLDLTSNNDNGVNGDNSAEGVFNADTLAEQYARSDYDSRQRFSGDAVWNVPGLQHGIGHVITSGWNLSPIIIFQTGQPFTVYTSAQYSDGGDYNGDGFDYDIPNVPSFGRKVKTSRSDFLNGLFPSSAFPTPTPGTEGNLGRNTYDGPWFAQTNLSVQRSFDLPFFGETGKLELRGEFINLFNRVNLTNPTGDMNNALFGFSTGAGQDEPRFIQVTGHIRF
jgi:Carboxypeptidase regulatory-like domain